MTLEKQVKEMQKLITTQQRTVADLQKQVGKIEKTVTDTEFETVQEEQQALLLLNQQKLIAKLEDLDETNALLLLNSINPTEEV